jgi:hypothetical protein
MAITQSIECSKQLLLSMAVVLSLQPPPAAPLHSSTVALRSQHSPPLALPTMRLLALSTGLDKSSPSLGDFVQRSFSTTSSDQLIVLAPAYGSNKSLSDAV